MSNFWTWGGALVTAGAGSVLQDLMKEVILALEKVQPQISRTLIAAEHHSTRHNTAAARWPPSDALAPNHNVRPVSQTHSAALAALRWPLQHAMVVPAPLHHADWGQDYNMSTIKLKACSDPMGAARLWSAFGNFPHQVSPWPEGYISSRHSQRNPAGKCCMSPFPFQQ